MSTDLDRIVESHQERIDAIFEEYEETVNRLYDEYTEKMTESITEKVSMAFNAFILACVMIGTLSLTVYLLVK